MSQVQNPNVSVDCVVFGFDGEDLKVLLIKQKDIGNLQNLQFALPGDLIIRNEGLDQAASRVLTELTGLKGIFLKQFHTFGDPNRVKDLKDQEWLRTFRDNPTTRVITVAYFSLVNVNDFTPEASSFADEATWTELQEVPELAFDHNEILANALEVLRDALVTKHIGFELLPEKFTLSQLQILYEKILDKKLDKRNFRKKLKKIDKIIPLNEKQKGVYHKPAQLYKLKPEES